MVKLVKVVPSTNFTKKYDAHFNDNGREFKTSFGDSTAEDFTQHGDFTRRASYRSRHKKDLETGDPTRAGYLSYYILWGDDKSIRKNIASYKRRFNM
jgi:hypothetical protein